MIKNCQVMDHKIKNLLNIFGNLKSSSWHFLRLGSKTKNKFSFSEDFWKFFCRISHFLRVSRMQWLYFLLFTKVITSTVDKCFKKNFFTRKWSFFMDRIQRIQPLWEGSLLFTLSPQEYLVLISLTSKEWRLSQPWNHHWFPT